MPHKFGRGLTKDLYEHLGQAIIRGSYDQSGFPIEAELSAEFNASRSTIRETVKMLSSKGLLRSRTGTGTQLESIDRWNLMDPDVLRWIRLRPFSKAIYREFTEVRLAIEPTAAWLAAQQTDLGKIQAIRESYELMAADSDDSFITLQADIDFHVGILRAAGNRFLWQLQGLIDTALNLSISMTNQIVGPNAALKDHEAVLIAIENKNPEMAEKSMQKILVDSLRCIDENS